MALFGGMCVWRGCWSHFRGFRASTTAPWHLLTPLAVTQDCIWHPLSGPTSVVIAAWWHLIHIPIHSICQSPCIWMWMWESFHNDNVGLEPQPLHARRMQTRSNLLFLYPRKRPLDRVLDLARVGYQQLKVSHAVILLFWRNQTWYTD